MAATIVDVTQVTTLFPTQASGLDPALFVAADEVNGNRYRATGRELLILHNTDSGNHTYDVTSVANALGRTGDIAGKQIDAGEYLIAFLAVEGWRNSDGYIEFKASDPTVEILVARLPGA